MTAYYSRVKRFHLDNTLYKKNVLFLKRHKIEVKHFTNLMAVQVELNCSFKSCFSNINLGFVIGLLLFLLCEEVLRRNIELI